MLKKYGIFIWDATFFVPQKNDFLIMLSIY